MYRTVDPQGQSVIASGLLVLPTNPAEHLWTVSFTHGTSSYRPQAPSKQPAKAFVAAPAISYAAAGFAAVAPDYVGLGAGTGVHPWMHVPTETSAALDMLRAARTFTQRAGRSLDDHILITGFSQGASAALGLARALQSGAEPGFIPSAVAPISGAYDFERAELPALVDGEVPGKIGVAYAAYLLVAWNRVHQLYESPAEFLQSPYAGRVEMLFDGSTDGPEMLAALPDTVDQLLTAAGLDLFRHPGGPFLAALQEADSVCTDWASQAPVRLYRADEDEQAVIANTDHCQNAFRDSHVEVPVITVGTPRYQGSLHLGSAVAATEATLRWFTDLHPGL